MILGMENWSIILILFSLICLISILTSLLFSFYYRDVSMDILLNLCCKHVFVYVLLYPQNLHIFYYLIFNFHSAEAVCSFTSRAYSPFFFISVSCVPLSATTPPSSTMIWSAFSTGLSLCAITSTVFPLTSLEIASWISVSLSTSRDAVASSIQ